MKISKFLLAIILIPIFIGVTVACYFQLNRYQIMTDFIHSNSKKQYLNYVNHLEEKLSNVKKITEIFSQNKQIIEALNQQKYQLVANEALDFSKLMDSEIYFTDLQHKVLIRSETTTAVGELLVFNDACLEKQLLKNNNKLKITYCRKLIDVEKNPIGYVLAMRLVNKEFLEDIAKEIFVESALTYNGFHFSSLRNENLQDDYERQDFAYQVDVDTIHFTLLMDDKAALGSLRQTFVVLLATTLLVGLVLMILIPLFIKKYISTPLELIEKKIALFYKNEIVNDEEKIPNNETKKIYRALHRLQVSVQEKEHQLKEKSEILEKDNLLLRVISHDVSNTLTVIQGSLVRLKRSEQITMQKKNEILDKILATVRIAGGVLQHVKEIKALETGKMDLKLEPTSIQEIFDVAQIIFEDRLTAKKIKLTLEDLSNGAHFLCHKSSFTNSVFNNFISNAIKFSSHGSEIAIKAYTDNTYFYVAITDEGIGIPEEIAAHIFDIGKATTRVGTDGEGGTGFGMTLAKTYMEHYKGELRFSSRIAGKTGTTFELLLQKVS